MSVKNSLAYLVHPGMQIQSEYTDHRRFFRDPRIRNIDRYTKPEYLASHLDAGQTLEC
jgi:hypothetical protein